MKRRTLISISIVAVLALAAVPLVYAQSHRGHGGGDGFGGGMMFGRLLRAKEALGLTDAQVDQIKAIGADLRTQNEPLRDQLKAGIGSIAQTLLNNPNDLAAAQQLLDQQEQAEHTMKANALAAAAKAINVLTPEQRTKAAQFLAARLAHHGTH
jgi:Spy/CpxP family protein refolding chaperone